MRAVVVDPDAPERLAIREVGRPDPLHSEALVRVAAVSVNRGEVRRAGSAEAGWRIGWDLAGTIEEPAADGSSPPAGTRVVGFLDSGAWAEYAAVPSNALAALPDEVSFAQASTLPVAGLTALRALEHGGLAIGRRILITGASGGVGQFAIPIARHAGAFVVGAVHRRSSEAVAREAGAHEVISGDVRAAEAFGPYHLILDSIGGETIATALGLLAQDGTCVSFGITGGVESTINVARFYGLGGARLYGFILFYEHRKNPVAGDLARLVAMVADGRLRAPIELEAPWTEVAETARKLTDREITGKAVLHVQ